MSTQSSSLQRLLESVMTTGRLSLRACGPVIFAAVMGVAATGAEPTSSPIAAPAERVLVID